MTTLLQPSLTVSTAREAQIHMSRRGWGSHVDKSKCLHNDVEECRDGVPKQGENIFSLVG